MKPEEEEEIPFESNHFQVSGEQLLKHPAPSKK